jgi:hypothetical protein
MEEDVRTAWEALEQAHAEGLTGDDSMLNMLDNTSPTVVQLSDGDWHVCERERCPHACVDIENHAYFCSLSGLCWGTEFVGDSEPTWTGRSTTTGDPDAISGTPIGGWRPRRDAFAESQRAFHAASAISDREVVYVETQRERDAREARCTARRGALCVDQEPDEAPVVKKPRASKRPPTRELYEKLSAEVNTVIDKLTSVKRESNTPSAPWSTSAEDVRLHNPDFVLKVAIRQLVKRAQVGDDVLSNSRVHDVTVYAHAFAKRKREEAAAHAAAAKGNKRRKGFGGDTKTRIVNLVLSLWKAACATEYLSNDAKRGADSFRPFVSGILYATKRGVCMSNGMEIVPEVPSIADQLPTLRSQDATDQARQLQSSSHRGLCCLHRSIASFETADLESESYDAVKRAFEDASNVAAQLRAYCS